MKCSEALPLLDLLYDQLLETKDSALLLDHLKNCDGCQSEWEGMEDLKRRFTIAKSSTTLPKHLIDQVAIALKREDKSNYLQTNFSQLPLAGIAASILVLGWLIVPQFNVTRDDRATIASSHSSAKTLIQDLTMHGSIIPEPDKRLLNKRLGYELKFVNLPAWTMESAGLYTQSARIARFDFVNKNNANEHLHCYQALEGTISATGVERTIGGKPVIWGSESGYQFAKFSQNGRDYLFVTKLPDTVLEEIVSGA